MVCFNREVTDFEFPIFEGEPKKLKDYLEKMFLRNIQYLINYGKGILTERKEI